MITITDGEEVCTVYNIENNGYAIGVMTLTELSPLMSLGNRVSKNLKIFCTLDR